jgi:hypothetical protein
MRAMVAARQELYREATDALEEALALSYTMPYPYAEAKALWVYGQVEVARGDAAAAQNRFAAALAICDRLGEGLYRPHIEHALNMVSIAER